MPPWVWAARGCIMPVLQARRVNPTFHRGRAIKAVRGQAPHVVGLRRCLCRQKKDTCKIRYGDGGIICCEAPLFQLGDIWLFLNGRARSALSLRLIPLSAM